MKNQLLILTTSVMIGWSHLLVDDDKTRLRSKKVAELCLVRSKSNKAFGAVGHCVMSMYTGIQLSCQYSHFGESTSDSLLNNLCIIQGVTSPKSIDLGETLVVSASGTPVHTFVLLQRKAQQRILQARSAASLRAGRKLEVLLSPTMVRGDPLEERSKTIFNETPSRKLIV